MLRYNYKHWYPIIELIINKLATFGEQTVRPRTKVTNNKFKDLAQ